MKKIPLKLSFLIILVFGLAALSTGCGDKGFKESFTGIWNASQNSLNGNIYTGNIVMEVQEDGAFTISDDLGGINMSGDLKVVDETSIQLKCSSETFTPPTCWNSSETDTYNYDFISEDVVVIDYLGNEIAFFRGVENQTPEELKNDNWLTNNGLDSGEITYRVKINDEDIDFFIVDGENIVRLFHGRNLQYDSSKEQLSFVPDTSVGYEPPVIWYSDMGNEIKEIVLDVVQKDNYIILSYEGNEIKFYNDLLYNMDTESDIYNLMDSNWTYEAGGMTYELNLIFGDSIYAYCKDEDGNDVFGGTVLLDENAKTMYFYFDIKSGNTDFWGGITDEMSMTYLVTADKFDLTYNGNTVEFKRKS